MGRPVGGFCPRKFLSSFYTPNTSLFVCMTRSILHKMQRNKPKWPKEPKIDQKRPTTQDVALPSGEGSNGPGVIILSCLLLFQGPKADPTLLLVSAFKCRDGFAESRCGGFPLRCSAGGCRSPLGPGMPAQWWTTGLLCSDEGKNTVDCGGQGPSQNKTTAVLMPRNDWFFPSRKALWNRTPDTPHPQVGSSE